MLPGGAGRPEGAEAARPVRVMVVDDSAVVRGLVGRWIAAEPGLAAVAAAPNGRAALDMLAAAAPDIVLLDLDMPVLDGVATLPLLLRQRPGLSVVVVSTLTRRNAEISLRCLSLGAVECLSKPSGPRDLTVSASFRTELLGKLHALATRHRRREGAAALPPEPAPRGHGRDHPLRARAVLIGASTGGPRAAIEVLRGLGGVARQVPILLVQHMPPIFMSVFAAQVAAETGIAAAEARDGEPVGPGRIYVAPGGRHMGLRATAGGAAIRLDDGPALRHCRPAVDVLLRDAAEVWGATAVAAILTGMGCDGLDGARVLAGLGATILAQDEATSVVWGMPGAVAKAGLARRVLPLGEMAAAIEARVGGGDLAARPARRAVA